MGRREKGEKLSPKVRTRGMLEVGQKRQQDVPDNTGQECEGRLAALQASEAYFFSSARLNTRRKACGGEMGTKYRHLGRQMPTEGRANIGNEESSRKQ